MDEERWTPMVATFPDEKTIQCKDCQYRDKMRVEIGGKVFTGIAKDTCEMYTGYDKKNGTGYKPHEILFDKGECMYYKKENG